MSNDENLKQFPTIPLAIVAVLGIAAIAVFLAWPSFGQKEEPAEATDTVVIPDGTPSEILQFAEKRLDRLRENPPKSKEAERKELGIVLKAAEKALAGNPKDAQVRLEAIGAKVAMLRALGQLGDDAAPGKLTEYLKTLKSDKDAEVRELAGQQILLGRAYESAAISKSGQAALSKDVLDYIRAGELKVRFSLGMRVAQVYEQTGQTETAAAMYLGLAGLLKSSGNPDFVPAAAQFEGQARRLRLPGSELTVLKGQTVDDKLFNWSNYRGKVVLIDFWATWCRPCIAEMPNVLDNYRKYHQRGFEVVGVSLDSSRDRLLAFVKDRNLPWTNLFEDNGLQTHPMASYYGVPGIPFTILVGRDGKVVATNVRGDRLGELLAKQFNETAQTAPPVPRE